MPDKDVDEQFAAIMAHWHEDALGLDPYGDPDRGDRPEPTQHAEPDLPDERDGRPHEGRAGDEPGGRADSSGSPTAHLDELDALSARDLDDLRDLDAPATGAVAPAPAAEPTRPTPPITPVTPVTPVVPVKPVTPVTPADATPRPGSAWRAHVPVEDPEDEHYVPPPPQPLPSSEDKHFWLMMLGLVGGPLLFLWLILFDRDGNGWWMVGAIAMTVAGFVLLVLRQPFERDEDDDGVRL